MRRHAAFVGLGSNLGDRLEHLRRAVALLDASDGLRFVRCSAVYETDPVGPPQPDYLNAVAEVETTLGPRDVLERLKEIERELGREQRERWGPREIDLDLLLYDAEEIEEPGLTVPHPEMASRAFVLVPLCELAPFARVGTAGRVAELVERVSRDGVRRAHGADALWPDGR